MTRHCPRLPRLPRRQITWVPTRYTNANSFPRRNDRESPAGTRPGAAARSSGSPSGICLGPGIWVGFSGGFSKGDGTGVGDSAPDRVGVVVVGTAGTSVDVGGAGTAVDVTAVGVGEVGEPVSAVEAGAASDVSGLVGSVSASDPERARRDIGARMRVRTNRRSGVSLRVAMLWWCQRLSLWASYHSNRRINASRHRKHSDRLSIRCSTLPPNASDGTDCWSRSAAGPTERLLAQTLSRVHSQKTSLR